MSAASVLAAGLGAFSKSYDQIQEYWRLDSIERRALAEELGRSDGEATPLPQQFNGFLVGSFWAVFATIVVDLAYGWEATWLVLAAMVLLSMPGWLRKRIEGEEMLEAQQRSYEPFADDTMSDGARFTIPREAIAAFIAAIGTIGLFAGFFVLVG